MNVLYRWQESFETYLKENMDLSDGGHDISHFRRVWKLSSQFSGDEGGDKLTLLASAYFHDFVNYPKNHQRRSWASRDSAEKTKEILRKMKFPEGKLKSICHCIEAHSFSAGIEPKTIEAKILQDADRLEALGAIGLARVFYISGKMGSSLFCGDDPFAKSRELDDKKYALDHFFTKLLKLPQTMKTNAGKREATQRAKILTRFVEDLKGEIL